MADTALPEATARPLPSPRVFRSRTASSPLAIADFVVTSIGEVEFMARFRESDHPRDYHGRFTKKGSFGVVAVVVSGALVVGGGLLLRGCDFTFNSAKPVIRTHVPRVRIGQPIRIGRFNISALRQTVRVLHGANRRQIVNVTLKVTSTSNVPAYVHGQDQKLTDNQGRTFTGMDSSILVKSGRTVILTVHFKIPAGAAPREMEFHFSRSSRSITVDLRDHVGVLPAPS